MQNIANISLAFGVLRAVIVHELRTILHRSDIRGGVLETHGQIVRLHHIGFVVPSIQDGVNQFARSIEGSWDGKIFLDPLQGARVTFLAGKESEFPYVELVEPSGEKSPVINFLSRGGGLHHLCYEVKSLDQQLKHSRGLGAAIVRAPLPAVAFENRRIAWVLTRERLLVEFLEI
jgi:methylmalonyl-CoA/ethylmalonyl-CoA epimerase